MADTKDGPLDKKFRAMHSMRKLPRISKIKIFGKIKKIDTKNIRRKLFNKLTKFTYHQDREKKWKWSNQNMLCHVMTKLFALFMFFLVVYIPMFYFNAVAYEQDLKVEVKKHIYNFTAEAMPDVLKDSNLRILEYVDTGM